MIRYVLSAALIIPLPILSMDHLEIVDEVAQRAAQAHFSQTTINPALLSVAVSSSSETCSSEVETSPTNTEPRKQTLETTTADQKPQQHPALLVKTKTRTFVSGGTIYMHNLFTSQEARKRYYPHLTDWFNTALELLASREQPAKPLALTSKFPAKTYYTRSKTKQSQTPQNSAPNEVKLATKIQKRVKDTITAEQANQWLYFKNNPNKKRSSPRKKS